jgi:hypothetical protein
MNIQPQVHYKEQPYCYAMKLASAYGINVKKRNNIPDPVNFVGVRLFTLFKSFVNVILSVNK